MCVNHPKAGFVSSGNGVLRELQFVPAPTSMFVIAAVVRYNYLLSVKRRKHKERM